MPSQESLFNQAALAVMRNDTALLENLLDDGLDINGVDSFGITLLGHAAAFSMASTAAFLLQRNADINIPNALGRTPLMISASRGNIPMMEVLLDFNAKTDIQDKTDKSTALHIAFEHSAGTVDALFSLLVDAGASPFIKNDSGQTPLMLARERCPQLRDLVSFLKEAETRQTEKILCAIQETRKGTSKATPRLKPVKFIK